MGGTENIARGVMLKPHLAKYHPRISPMWILNTLYQALFFPPPTKKKGTPGDNARLWTLLKHLYIKDKFEKCKHSNIPTSKASLIRMFLFGPNLLIGGSLYHQLTLAFLLRCIACSAKVTVKTVKLHTYINTYY